MTFKEIYKQKLLELQEKTSTAITSEWHVCTLDDGTELSANLKLLAKDTIHIAKQNERIAKNISIKGDPIKAIEDELGYKLNLKDEKIQEFIGLLPCPCDQK